MAGTEVALKDSTGLLARFKQGDNPFLADAGNDEFFGAFLKFNGNTGDFNYGDDYAEEIPHGSELLLNMETALHGWICWVDGEVQDEQNVLIASGKSIADEDDLEDFGPYKKHSDGTQDGWSEQYVFHFFWEKTEEAFTLKLSSKSGLRSAKQLVRSYGKAFGVKIGDDGEIQVPVVEIGSTSFDVKGDDGKINKKAGKKHAPILKIVDWADKAEVADCFEAVGGDDQGDYENDEPEEKAAPARGARGKAEEAPTRGRGKAAVEEEAPARGRGRGRTPEPATEVDEPDQGDSADGADDDAHEAAEAPATGRRTRVAHAAPQDDDADVNSGQDDNPRETARGRRGRSRS